jgi:hypothetical protein
LGIERKVKWKKAIWIVVRLWLVLFLSRIGIYEIFSSNLIPLGFSRVRFLVLLDQEFSGRYVHLDFPCGFSDLHLVLKNLAEKLFLFLDRDTDTSWETLW